MIGLPIAHRKPAADRAQTIILPQHALARCIRVNDTAFGIDKEDAGAEGVQRIGECRSFRILTVDRPVDDQSTVGMRHEPRDPLPHFIVHHALADVNGEKDFGIRF
jgi:hypothetical protein